MFLELTHGMTNIARCKLYSLEELICAFYICEQDQSFAMLSLRSLPHH